MKNAVFCAMFALTTQLFGAGFTLQLEKPDANPEAVKANAVLLIKVVGSQDPAAAKVTANALRVVNGKRDSTTLVVTKLKEPGTFALTQQWTKEEKVVLELTGKAGDLYTYTLVPAGPNGVEIGRAAPMMKSATPVLENLLK